MTNSSSYLSELHELLSQHFNLAELRTLCLDLNVDYESVAGEEKPSRIRELLLGLGRNGRLPELITLAQQQRPLVEWPPVPDDFEMPESFETAEPANDYYAYGDIVHGDKIGGDKIVGNKIVYQGLSTEEVADLAVKLKHKGQPKVWDGRIPYLGLQAFQEDDAEFFFGRKKVVNELLARLERSPFLAIAGPSGSGKSSIARAGLLHALRQGRLERSERWLFATMHPGSDPLEQLAQAVNRLAQSPTADHYIRDNGRTDPNALYHQVETLLQEDRRQRAVLLVDQFEEIFSPNQNEAERAAFINLLATATQNPQSRLNIILTLRSDFIPACADYPQLNELINQQFYQVGSMTPRELGSAIIQPALEVGITIDPELVAHVTADMKGEPGALPLMSFALRNLFQATPKKKEVPVTLTLSDYLQRGGIESALERHADQVFVQFSERRQVLARHIFSRLVDVGERVDTRRTATLDELVPGEYQREEVAAIIHALASDKVRLLTTDRAQSDETTASTLTTVTLAHEKLIDAWPWLHGLVDENREAIALQNQIASDARAWAKEEDAGYLYRDGRLLQVEEKLEQLQPNLDAVSQHFIQASLEAEKQRQRTRRFVQVGGAVVLAILVMLGIGTVLINSERNNAIRARETAVAAQATSDVNAAEANIAQATAESAAITEGEARGTAVAAQSTAQADATLASAAEAAAVDAQLQTEVQRRLVQVQSLAFQGLNTNTGNNDSELRTLLALEANRLNQEVNGPFQILIDTTLRTILTEPFFNNTLSGHEDTVTAVTFSSDGQWLASGSSDNTIRLWNLNDLLIPPIVMLGHIEPVTSLAFSPNGEILASGSIDDTIRLWNLNDTHLEPTILSGHRNNVESVVFSPDGKTLASGSSDGTIRLWDMTDLTIEPSMLIGHERSVFSITFSPDGQMLASGGMDFTVRLWDIADPEVGSTILGHHGWVVLSVAFSPDGRTLASGSLDGTARLWNIDDPNGEAIVLNGQGKPIPSVVFSPDGQTLASGHLNTVRLWKLDDISNDPILLEGHQSDVTSVAFSEDGLTLASASEDKTIRLWNLGDAAGSPAVLDGTHQKLPVAFSPNGQILAISIIEGVDNSSIRLLDSGDLSVQRNLIGHEDIISSLAFSPDGNLLASYSADNTIRLWDLNNIETDPIVLELQIQSPYFIKFSPNSQMLVAGGGNNVISLWDLDGIETEPTLLELQIQSPRFINFSPDSQMLVANGGDDVISLWNLNNLGLEPLILSADGKSITQVVFSDDGQILAAGTGGVGTRDNKVLLWQTANLESAPYVLDAFGSPVESVVFSPDNQLLVASSLDSTIRLWDLNNLDAGPVILENFNTIYSLDISSDGQFLAGATGSIIKIWSLSDLTMNPSILSGYTNSHSVKFSPNNSIIVSRSIDNTLGIWPILPQLIEIGCQTVWRNLTWTEWQQYMGSDKPYRQTCPQLPVHPSVP